MPWQHGPHGSLISHTPGACIVYKEQQTKQNQEIKLWPFKSFVTPPHTPSLHKRSTDFLVWLHCFNINGPLEYAECQLIPPNAWGKLDITDQDTSGPQHTTPLKNIIMTLISIGLNGVTCCAIACSAIFKFPSMTICAFLSFSFFTCLSTREQNSGNWSLDRRKVGKGHMGYKQCRTTHT